MGELMTGLGRLNPLAWLSAACAGLAVLGLLGGPSNRLRRTRTSGEQRRRSGPARFGGRAGPDLSRRLALGTVAGAGVCLAASSLGPGPGWWAWLAWPVLAAVAAVLLGVLEPRSVRVRRERLAADAPQALDLMAAGLDAGMPVRLAARVVAQVFGGPVGEDLGRVLALADLGTADAEAWRSLAGHPQLGAAAADLARSVESGTFMVEALGRHAAAAREARRAALAVRARSVGVSSVLPLMACFIPAFLLLGVVPTVASALMAALG